MVTRYPLDCRSLAREAEIIPFPNDEVTPPVTKMYLVMISVGFLIVFIEITVIKLLKTIKTASYTGFKTRKKIHKHFNC